jgi:hypothetical protein
MRSTYALLTLSPITALMIATSPAHAQPMSYEEAHPRVGLELGIGAQAGNLFCQSADQNDCNGVTAAGGLDLQGGWFMSPQLGVVLDLWGMAHTENNVTIAQYVNTVGLKFRLNPILYIQGGIGDAHVTLSYGNQIAASTQDAFAVMGALGLVILRGHRFDFSIEGRFGTGFYNQDQNGQAQTIARNAGIGAQLTFFGF